MALNIKDSETEKPEEALSRLGPKSTTRRLANELDEIAIHCAGLPVLDPRSPDEILGYDAD